MNQIRSAPPPAAGTLYEGNVMHARLKPFSHRFTYRVFSVLIDIGALDKLNAMSRLFSVNRFNVLSFFEKDHIDPRVSPVASGIKAHAETLLSNAGIVRPARILLLAYPRVFGHAFNPISVYFVYDRANELSAVIYEVRNTFGERHSYVCPVAPGELGPAGLFQSRAKTLHVSPFIPMQARYDFRLQSPSDTLRFHILEHDSAGPLLAASFSAKAMALNSKNLLGLLVRIPLLGLKVVGLIHFEALRLWLKGAIFRKSPPPPAPSSHINTQTKLHTGE